MSSPRFCAACGTALPDAASFCSACGGAVIRQVVAEPPPSPPLPSGAGGATAGAMPSVPYRTGVVLAGLPLELWAVIALFALPGVYLAQAALRALPDTLRLFDLGGFAHTLAFVLLVLLVLIGALGGCLLAIALLLYRADRVGRGLAYVAIASLVALVVFGDGVSTGEILSMLAGLAAAAVLALAPAVREVFTGSRAPTRGQPTSIVVARVSLAVWIGLLGLSGILYLLLADIEGKYAAIGILLLGLTVGALVLYRRLEQPDRKARTVASVGAVAAVILLLAGLHYTGFTMLIGLTVAIPAFLWLPADARRFYGEEPLNLHGRA
jgi:hypothetical protein